MSSKSRVVVSALKAAPAKKSSSVKPALALAAVPAPTKIAAAACSKCGRVNSHGSDCRSAAACAARRKDATPASTAVPALAAPAPKGQAAAPAATAPRTGKPAVSTSKQKGGA